MKAFIRLLLIVLILAPALYAQTETFDIATFVRPAGWIRAESNGILVLGTRRKVLGRVEFCQIYLFPSGASDAAPEANFERDWDAHIVTSLGIQARPSPQKETTPDGWTALTGYTDTVRQGMPTRAILVTSTGFGRSVSIVVTVSPNAYQAELEQFFKDVNFHVAPAQQNSRSDTSQPTGPPTPERSNDRPETAGSGGLENYVFATPPSWTAQHQRDAIVLASPVYENRERCQLTLFPMRTSSRPLEDEAIGLFRQLFRTDPLTTYPSPPPRMAHGISPQGWEYFTMRKLVGGQEGEARTTGVTLLLARVDTQLATIIGTSKDFLWSQCFGELQGDAWPPFLASLQFKNAQPSNQVQATIRQRLAGTWITATASVGLRYVFLANGRYQGAGATQYRTRTSDTQVLQTTQAYFGDGAYSFEGGTIILTGDDHRRSVKSFRLEQVSKDSGHTWHDELCMADPGSKGEVCYRRE